jgi:hypothetical protein
LAASSQISFGCIWGSIVVALSGILGVWFKVPSWGVVIWMVLLSAALIGFVVAVSLMWYLDGRFFSLVNRIIEPEGE